MGFFGQADAYMNLVLPIVVILLVLFVPIDMAEGSDRNMDDKGDSKTGAENEAFIEAFIDTVFPSNRPTELVRRRREDIDIVVRGNATFEIFKYIDSTITALSKLLPYDVVIRDRGDVNTAIVFTDDVRRDSFGALSDVIRHFLLPDQTVEDAFWKFGDSKCLIITPGDEDKVLGLLMVSSNRTADLEYVKFCIKSGLLRSMGLLGERAHNELLHDEQLFHISDLDKRILDVLYSNRLNGKDFKGAVRVLRE